jgi:hypothetical protein
MENRIHGFQWYLPLAYKDSVAQCKFEQGDVIYRKEAQLTWDEFGEVDFLFQVKSPSRMDNAKGDFDVFNYNWDSEIIVEQIYPKSPALNKIITTTQGSFYSFLWKNDENLLERKALPPVLNAIRPKHINSEFIKTKIPSGNSGFATIIDTVSDLSGSKRKAINEIFSMSYTYTTQTFSSYEAISDTALMEESNSGFSPTIAVELHIINSNDVSHIKEQVKVALYKGLKDRFNINSHGIILNN